MSLSPREHASSATGIMLVAAALLTIGLVMVASAGARLDHSILRLRFWETSFGRQALFSALGFVALVITSHGIHRWFRWRPGSWFQPAALFFAATAICLVVALLPGIGVARKGAQRWIQVGPSDLGLVFQPSELAKLALVVLLAALLAHAGRRVRSFARGVLPACMLIGLCVGLVGIEDFGTAALLGAVGGAMLLVAGARLWQLAGLALPGIGALVYLILREPYRIERLTTFMNIWEDPRGAGYHPVQSLVTIASGGFTGRGLGAGIQKYGYLPEARTDFIFSVICEESGLIGAGIVILLFLALLAIGWRVVRSAPTVYGRLLAFGVTFMIAMQAAINIAVVTVWAPTKGISLPLVSAGGSGVIFLGLAVGLLASVARDADERDEAAAIDPAWDAMVPA